MTFTSVVGKVPQLLPEFKPALLGADGELDEVSVAATIHEHKTIDSYLSVHEDPWYNMSVKDQLEQTHMDGSHTTVRYKSKRRQHEQSQFDKEAAWQMKMFGDYAGGYPRITEHHRQTLEDLAANDKSLIHPALGRKKVSPWSRDYQFSRFTAGGDALKEYQQTLLDGKIEHALQAFKAETQAAIDSKSRKSSRKSKKLSQKSKKSSKYAQFPWQKKQDAETEESKDADDNAPIDRYEVMKTQIGGDNKADAIAASLQNLAIQVSKQAKLRKKAIDTSLDLVEACDKLRVVKVLSLLMATDTISPNMLTSEEEPLFLHCLNRLLRMDSVTNSLHKSDVKRETGDRRQLQRILGLLVKYGADINTDRGREGLRAIHLVSAANNTKVMMWLLSLPAIERDALSVREQTTALMVATKFAHIEMMALLVGQGVQLDARDPQGRTALHHAALFGHTRASMFLLRVGADKLLRDEQGATPAQLAQEGSYLACAQSIAAFATPLLSAADQLHFLADLEATRRRNLLQQSNDALHLNDMLSMGNELLSAATSQGLSGFLQQGQRLLQRTWKQLRGWLQTGKDAQVHVSSEEEALLLELQKAEEEEKEEQRQLELLRKQQLSQSQKAADHTSDENSHGNAQDDADHEDAVRPFAALTD